MPCVYSNRPNNVSVIHEDVSLKFTDIIKLVMVLIVVIKRNSEFQDAMSGKKVQIY